MIQIRNVPEAMHRELKARAARAGMTLSDYLLDMVRKETERPELEVLLARLRQLEPVEVSVAPADVIRELRGEP